MAGSTGAEELQKELSQLLRQQAELAKACGSTLAGPVAASQRRMVAGTKAAISAAQAPGYMSYRRVSACVLTATAIRCVRQLGGSTTCARSARPDAALRGRVVAFPLSSGDGRWCPSRRPLRCLSCTRTATRSTAAAAAACPQRRQSTGGPSHGNDPSGARLRAGNPAGSCCAGDCPSHGAGGCSRGSDPDSSGRAGPGVQLVRLARDVRQA